MLFQSTGQYLVHSLQLHYVRYEMKQRIKAGVPEEDLVVLKITKQQEENPEVFERIHAREFRFKGQMYDIIRQHAAGDTTYYTCIHDVKESRLFAQLDRMVQDELQGNENQRRQKELSLSFFTKVYLVPLVAAGRPPAHAQRGTYGYSEIFSEKHITMGLKPPQAWRPFVG